MAKNLVLATAAVALLLSSGVVLGGGSGWLVDYGKALEKAKESGRPVLVEFSKSDTCAKCKNLTREVFYKSQFKKWAKENVVLLSVDFPERKKQSDRVKEQNEKLLEKYGVEAFPALLLLDQEGEVLVKLANTEGDVEDWLAESGPIVAGVTRDAGKWHHEWEKARKLSEATGRPILADFTGSDWCGWCIKLKKEVFDTPRFKEWAAKRVILLELDYPRNKPQTAEIRDQNEELKRKYQISGYPTVLFLDHSGKALAKSGYLEGGPEAWIADAERKLK